jgi:hypothetical protein
VSTARTERLHTRRHFSNTVLAVALLSTALVSAQEQKLQRDPRIGDNRVTITNRRIIENGSTTNSYNGFPGVVDARGGNYLLNYRKGTGHTNTPWVILRHNSDSGVTWGPELFQWNTNGFDPTLAKTPSQGALLIEFGKLNPSGTAGAAYSRSSDEGFSWSAFTFFDSRRRTRPLRRPCI